MMDDIASLKWVLLGSCIVKHPNCVGRGRGVRGVVGLILYPVPNSVKFYRVGVFFPTYSRSYEDGVRLFRTAGEIRTMTVI